MTLAPQNTQAAMDLGSRWTTVAEGTTGGAAPTRTRRVPGPGARALGSLANAGAAGSGIPALSRTLTAALGTDARAETVTSAVASVVVAVPDQWSVDPTGVLARERLRDLLHREHGVTLLRCVAQAEAAAAAVAAAGNADGPVLVCDLGAGTATVAYCEIDGPRVELLDLETAEDGATAGAFVAALAAAAGPPGAPLSPAATDDLLTTGLRRIGMVLERAATQPRYRTTPVLRATGIRLTAGDVLGCFQPVAARLTEMINALAGRRAEVAAVRTVALAGGLAGFPLTAPTTLSALRTDQPPAVTLLEQAAVAVGAAAVGNGAVEVAVRGAALGLPVHRVRRGLLTEDRIVLNRVGAPLPIDVEHEGAPLVVKVGDLQPPAGAPLVLHVDRAGTWRRAAVHPDALVPPGRYRAGLWPAFGHLGALVLRPLDGGDPLVYTVSEPDGLEGAR